jgi:TRAP transporter 4TM/12TM fusion protein
VAAHLATLSRMLRLMGLVLAFFWSVFHLGIGLTTGLPDLVYLPLHVVFAVAISLAIVPAAGVALEGAGNDSQKGSRGVIDLVFSFIGVAAAIYIGYYFVANANALSRRIPMVFSLSETQIAIAIVLIGLVLEATRRTAGMGMVIVVSCFILYALFGHYVPGIMASTPMGFDAFLDQQVYTTSGIFGVPTSISATYVFYFVLFAAFLEFSGGGKLFIDLALGVTRRARGGPAKAAVVSSGLMGMTSGSAVANVMSTGVFTIPLMTTAGYSKRMAAATEAMASTGAQIMPPLMGAAAFIMAATLGVPYINIAWAAAIPALLFFTTVFIAVDFEARKRGMVADRSKGGPNALMANLTRLHLLLPLIYLVWSIVTGRSLMMSALEAIGLCVLASWVLPDTRLYPLRLIELLAKGGARVISVAVPCAAAGIVVGVVSQTGIGVRFTEVLVSVSQANLFLALVIVMFGCLVMGMGLPTTAAYIMAATLFAPALVRLGIEPLAAHFFVFYFACLSMITPPVALASYAAASVSGASASATGWLAAWVGLPLFLIPFAFVTDMALLGQEPLLYTLSHIGTALIGVTFFVAALSGFLIIHNKIHESLLFFAGAAGFFFPNLYAALAGAVLIALGVGLQYRRYRASPSERTQEMSAAQTAPIAQQPGGPK